MPSSVRVLRQSQPAECEVLWRLRCEAWAHTVALPAPPVAITRHLNRSISAASAERRQLTVMFCDLVDSTALLGCGSIRRHLRI